MGQKINIYTIYAQEDAAVMDTLLSHLKPLQKEFNDTIWHNDPIATGQPWMPLVESRLQADIFLLLVSETFMNSNFTTQLEFKKIIERHRKNKAVVIPIIIESCQWDVNFDLWDYEFNLNELPVLPDEARPIADWGSLDHAYANVGVGLKKVLDSNTENNNKVKSEKDETEKVTKAQREEQLEMGFTEEKVAKPLEEKKEDAMEKTAKKKEAEPKEEPEIIKGIETKKETEPIVETEEERENRLWEENEAKRRSEAAKRLKDAAAASAKRRDEEDKLWEEGVARRKAEKEQRIREAAANPKAHEEQRLEEEAAAKKRDEEAQKRRQVEQKTLKEEADATSKRKAKEESKNREADKLAKQKVEKQQRLLKEVEAKRKAVAEDRAKAAAASAKRKTEQEQSANAKVADKHATETSNLKKQTNDANDSHDANDSIKSTSSEKKGGMNKKMLLGLLVALIAILAIWTFSKNDSDTEEVDPERKIETIDGEDSDLKDSPIEKTTIDTPKPATTTSKLEVGDSHAGGIVFSIEEDGKLGKIAQTKDAGPISWQDAIKIHEQLGEGWRLPSFYELSKMYRTIGQGATNSGQFADELYWSATDYDDYQARLLRFRDGNTSYHYNKNVENRKFLVRAIRDFSQ